MDIRLFAQKYLCGLSDVLATFDLAGYERIACAIMEAYEGRRQIFIMGNGGSAATASHFACDINKGCCLDLEKKFKVLCLNDSIPTMLALANDVSYDAVFEGQLANFFNPGDLVIGISGSGNSENVLRAIRYAREKGGRTIGLCGFSGGRLSELVDISFVAKVHDMQKVEDIHMIVIHMLMQTLHGILHPETAISCQQAPTI